MSPAEYRQRIAKLGLTQEQAGEAFGVSGRTGQAWASEGPPRPVAMVLHAVGSSRKKFDNLLKKALD